VSRAGRGHRAASVPGVAQWHVGKGLAAGRGVARCSAPTPLRGGCVGQGEGRRGSSRRLGGGGVSGAAGAAAFRWRVASSGALLWLEAEAREGTVSAASEQDKKHGEGGNSGRRLVATPF
jgi:hypothetical protein